MNSRLASLVMARSRVDQAMPFKNTEAMLLIIQKRITFSVPRGSSFINIIS